MRETKTQEQTEILLRSIITTLDDLVNGPGPKKTGMTLLMYPFGEVPDGRMNYVSNSNRKDMICALKEMIAVLEGRALQDGHA